VRGRIGGGGERMSVALAEPDDLDIEGLVRPLKPLVDDNRLAKLDRRRNGQVRLGNVALAVV
jgi:hypothetical protein